MALCNSHPTTKSNQTCTSACNWHGNNATGYYWCSTDAYTSGGKTYTWDYCNSQTSPVTSNLGKCCTTSCKPRPGNTTKKACWVAPYTHTDGKRYNWDYCPTPTTKTSPDLPACQCEDSWTYVKDQGGGRYLMMDIQGCWDKMWLKSSWLPITRDKNKKGFCYVNEKCKHGTVEQWPVYDKNHPRLNAPNPGGDYLRPDNILKTTSYNDAFAGNTRYRFQCQ
jgi:hypothetical protein